jgi:hypothetical protein
VERRIAGELARLSAPREIGGQVVAPAPYVRRHLAEHAAAGQILNDRTLTDEFLPYLDLPRLRAASTHEAGVADHVLPMLPVLRRAGQGHAVCATATLARMTLRDVTRRASPTRCGR